jgi:two-component system chemotaxis response regulator CheY
MKKKVMVIDDSSAIRQIVSFALKNYASNTIETIEASDGLNALSKLELMNVDLIVCDVNMPNMNGIELIQTLKTDAKYELHRFTPFIMLTSETGEELKNKGRDAGAKVWLIKPFQPAELIDAVKKLLPAV